MSQIATTSPAGGFSRRIHGRTLVLGVAAGAAVLLVAVALAFNGAGNEGAAAASPQWYTVDRASFDLSVIASGELESQKQVEIKALVEGTTTIVEVIDEGTAVKEGDVLIRLADEDIRERIENEMLTVERSRAEKVSADENLAIERSEANSAQRASEVALRLARLDLEKWANGDVVTRRDELRLALDRAEQKLTRAASDLKSATELLDAKFISSNELADAQLTYDEAVNALATARLKIEVYEKYIYPKEQDQFSSNVEQAEAELERTKRKNNATLVQAEANLQSKDRTLKIQQDRLTKLQQQLELTVIRAPQEGLVVYASSAGGGRFRGDPIIQGRQVRFNETLIILPDTSRMNASLRVHEARMASVRLNQPVTVTIDAWPGVPIAGRVSQIGVIAQEGNWWNQDLREYVVKVELPENAAGQSELKPAMRCTGEIIVGRVEDALRVPVQCVSTRGDEQFCYLRGSDGRPRMQPVKVGSASETWVEILEGLKAGDQVLTRAPAPGELGGG